MEDKFNINNFNYAMGIVFKNEGGFSDNKHDRGGRTNLGITQKTYNDYCKRHGIIAKDVKNLTKEEAKEVYYYDYWITSKACNIENPKEALILFDTAVLHGVNKAKQFYRQAEGDVVKILELRKKHYSDIVRLNPSQKIFLNGWNRRVDNLYKILND